MPGAPDAGLAEQCLDETATAAAAGRRPGGEGDLSDAPATAVPDAAGRDLVARADQRVVLEGRRVDRSHSAQSAEQQVHPVGREGRSAIERLGARLDGILRNHQRASNGTLRDTCVYSIVESEWPTVKAHLHWQLDRPR